MDKVVCDEIINVKETNFNDKNIICKTQSYILLTFLLFTIILLITFSIYCYLLKYQAKQKHLILFHDSKLKINQYWYYKLKMTNKVKDINIKNRIYYFFNDIIDIEHFDLNNIEIDKKSNKSIFIFCIGCVTVKQFVKIYSVNSLFLIFKIREWIFWSN